MNFVFNILLSASKEPRGNIRSSLHLNHQVCVDLMSFCKPGRTSPTSTGSLRPLLHWHSWAASGIKEGDLELFGYPQNACKRYSNDYQITGLAGVTIILMQSILSKSTGGYGHGLFPNPVDSCRPVAAAPRAIGRKTLELRWKPCARALVISAFRWLVHMDAIVIQYDLYIDFIHRLTWTFRIGGGKNFETEQFNLQGTNLQGPFFF